MVLRRIGPSTGEPTLEHAELAYLLDLELLPSVRCAALALAANLEPEQGLDAMSDPVVMRLDNSRASGFVDELDEMLVDNRTREFVIHGVTSSSATPHRPSHARRCMISRTRRYESVEELSIGRAHGIGGIASSTTFVQSVPLDLPGLERRQRLFDSLAAEGADDDRRAGHAGIEAEHAQTVVSFA
jgi:hypothetical protein